MANRTDNFNRANASGGLGMPSDGGSAWVELVSNFGIFSNQAYGAGNGTPTISYLDCGAGSYDGTLQVTTVSSGSTGGGFAFRIKSSDNSCYFLKVGGGALVLYWYNGSFNLVTTGGTVAAGDVVSAVFTGGTIVAKVNGVTAFTSTSNTNNSTETKHGLFSNGDSSSLWAAWSFTGGTPATLAQADPSVVSTSDTAINLLAPAASGGTSPYTYQWQRATAANGGYSNVGTNSLTLADSSGLSAGTTYWYTITATDSAGSPQTTTTYPLPAKLSGKAFKVRIIGDSHWNGGSPAGGQNAPTEFVARLGACLKPRLVSLGGNSTFGGAHSADWRPGAAGTPLEIAVAAANSSGDNLFVPVLGSNDATNAGNPPISPSSFGSDIAAAVAYIKANATGTPLVIALVHPFYYNDRNGTLDGLNALFAYAAQLDALADNITVFTVGLMTRYQIPTAQTTYLFSDQLHLSFPGGQNLSADLAAMDLAGKLQFATGSSGSSTGGFSRIFTGY